MISFNELKIQCGLFWLVIIYQIDSISDYNKLKMRFRATYRLMQSPSLYGGTSSKLPSCHEFSVGDVKIDYSKVKYNSIAEADVTLVVEKYAAKDSLHGPASLIKTRSIIYPCDKFS